MERIRTAAGHEQASHAFCALYMWQKDMALTLCLREDWFAVRYGDAGYFFPCGSDRGKREFLNWARTRGKALHYLGEEDIAFLGTHFPGQYQAVPEAGASEYLYDIEAQARLSGQAFAHARKRIRRLFAEEADGWRVVSLRAEHVPHIRGIVSRWYATRAEQGQHDAADMRATLSLLDAGGALTLDGVLAFHLGEAVAYMIGAPLSERVFSVHSAKHLEGAGDADFFCMQQLCQRLQGRYVLLNREEDLGLPGLRARKQQFRPMGLLDIWRADPRS